MKPRTQRLLFASSVSVATALLAIGCRSDLPDPLPPERLRMVDSITFAPATTQPETIEAVPTTAAVVDVAPREITLTLADVRERVLVNNLDIAVARIDPAIARETRTQAEAAFEAVFTTRASVNSSDRPTGTNEADTGLPVSSQLESWDVTPGVRVPLRTGGEVGIFVPLGRQAIDSDIPIVNDDPDYSSDLTISVSQPLLRGAGRNVTEQRIRAAYYQQQASEARTKLEVIRALTTGDRAFWRLAAARDLLAVRVAQVRLAETQLERARRQVRAGVAAEVEVVRAEAGLADAREAVILAETDLRDRQRELKRVMNDPDLPVESGTILIPDAAAPELLVALDTPGMIRTAIAQRMELLEIEQQVLEQAAAIAASRNALLPLVSLDYQFNVNGLGGDFSEAASVAGDVDFIDHRLGIQVEVPIGNREARAAYRASLLRRMQLLATRDGREQQVRLDVLGAIDRIGSTWQRVIASRERVRLNERLVAAEIRQFDQGVRTSTEVLEAQTRLGNAQSDLVAAQAEYQIAQIDLAFAMGMTLGQTRVEWAPATPPRE